MRDRVLVTTSPEGLQPLGTAAQRSYELVTGILRARLSEDHAALFAEPVATEHGDSIDWHAGAVGPVVRLPELDETDQSALRDRIGSLIGDIRAEADRLALSADPDDQRLGEALANAIEIPGEEMIFAARDDGGALRPILVHWAWHRNEARAVRGVLTAMVPRPVAPVSPAPLAATATAAPSRAPWWILILLGWLLLTAMIGAILYLLIAPCALAPGWFDHCRAPEGRLEAVLTEGRALEDEVATLEYDLARTGRECRPEPQEQAMLPEIPEPDEELTQRLEERGASRGDLNFALQWSTSDDIDLHVTCPTGERVFFRNKTACNGTLDLDANMRSQGIVADPVENVVFEPAMTGIYVVQAHLYKERTPGPKRVVLTVLRRDGPSQSYEAILGGNQRDWTLNISISR